MSPIQEQIDLPLEIEPKKKELTREEMHKIYLEAKARGPEMTKKRKEDREKRTKEEWEKEMTKLNRKRWEENHKEGDGSDYEEYLEMEKNNPKKEFKVVWSIEMPLSGNKDRYGDSIEDSVSLGDDGKWRIEKRDEISEEQAVEYIRRYFVEEEAQRLIEEIKKRKIENNL